jgi:hypothetical protein
MKKPNGGIDCLVGRATLPAAAFQAARRLEAGGSQDWLPRIAASRKL